MCSCDRRDFLRTGSLAALGAALPLRIRRPGAEASPFATAAPPEAAPVTAEAALGRLRAGNARFTAGTSRHPHDTRAWRQRLAAGQHPFATVIGCADSRVPPELLFDQGFGDLFTIRVAGQAVEDNVLGSVQYATLHLHTPLVVVLGHAECGAVKAALAARAEHAEEPKEIGELLAHVLPALDAVPADLPEAERLPRAVEANVRWAVRQVVEADVLGPEARVVGAVYDLVTGRVRFLE